MPLRMTEVVIDCADHERVVDFWQEALAPGYERRQVNEQYVALVPRRVEGHIAERNLGVFRWNVMADPDGNAFCINAG